MRLQFDKENQKTTKCSFHLHENMFYKRKEKKKKPSGTGSKTPVQKMED